MNSSPASKEHRRSSVQTVANAIGDSEKVVTVILGAGASVDAGIPTGAQVGEKLSPEDRAILKHELGEEEPWKFFDIVDVLAKFRGEQKVRDILKEILKREYISLGYEILAHYLHHNKISAVISLNHDQAFDESLDLESPSFRWQLRSRSEFDALAERLQDSDALPSAYLKVHGCVSRKLTFRIDRGSVAQLEVEKLSVLRRYLESADLILCIGWSMHDPDVFRMLSEVLGERREEPPDLIVVDKKPSGALISLVEKLGGSIVTAGASCFLNDVGDVVEGVKESKSRPASVGLHRHKIRATCFGEEGPLGVEPEFQAAVEIIMFALKARAQIEPRILFECGRTASLLAQIGSLHTGNNTSEKQVVALAKILDLLCEAGILQSTTGNRGAVYWLPSDGDVVSDADELLRDIAARAAFQLTRWENARRRGRIGADHLPGVVAELQTHLAALTTAFDVDLIPRARDFAMFRSPSIIDSLDVFVDSTTAVLCSAKEGSHLCVSTNTGEWMQKRAEEICRAGIADCKILVEEYTPDSGSNPFQRVARDRINGVREALRKNGLGHDVRQLNGKFDQLTAVCDANENLLKAIYFRREGKSTRISPVLLSDEVDLATVNQIWNRLWHKGRSLDE